MRWRRASVPSGRLQPPFSVVHDWWHDVTYYIRFFPLPEPRSFTLDEIRERLREADPLFDIENGELVHNGQLYGDLDVGWHRENSSC